MAARNDMVFYNYAFFAVWKAHLSIPRAPRHRLCALRNLLTSAHTTSRRVSNTARQEQPFVMPRPDLALLPVRYRRIPVLAVGKDVYLDTRVMLRTLETLPNVDAPRLGALGAGDALFERLFERYMIEGPVFAMAAGLIDVGVALDPTFNEDRKGMLGRSWTKEELEEGRAECLNYVRGLFRLLEETVLRDGREWILGSEGPKLADIEAIFLLDFVSDMDLAKTIITKDVFPKTVAWIARYRTAVEEAKGANPEPTKLDGEAAADRILRSDTIASEVVVDTADPMGLKEGAEVEVYAADWGSEHRDRGRLVGLTQDEVTIAVKSKGNVEIRVHAPRTGFKIKKIGGN